MRVKTLTACDLCKKGYSLRAMEKKSGRWMCRVCATAYTQAISDIIADFSDYTHPLSFDAKHVRDYLAELLET